MSLGGQEITILVVDDEPDIRRLLVALLAHEYTVIAAANADEALSVCSRIPMPDLLVTDIVRPGMDGVDFANRMMETDPDLPVLFISGCVPDKTVLSRFSGKHRAFLPKPFNYRLLDQKIRQLVQVPAPPREV